MIIYKPRAKTVNVSLDNIIRKIENDDKISQDLKYNFIDGYDNIPNKTKIQFHNKYCREYVTKPVERYYIEKNVEADDEKFIIKGDDLLIDIIPETSDKEDKSSKDKLKSDVTKTIVKTLTGQGLHFDKIKIDKNLLKKNI